LKTKLLILLVIIMSITFMGTAFAVPKGKTLEFKHSKEGVVTFSGDIHAAKGNKCPDCHNGTSFPKVGDAKKEIEANGGVPADLKMADMKAGKACGTCHNGTKAFASDKKENCVKCHKK